MNIDVKEKTVFISANGTEYLRIKADLYKILSNALSVDERNKQLSFPLSCLDIVSEKLPNAFKNISNGTSIFTNHSVAREKALSSLNRNDVSLINDFWSNILDLPQQYAVNAMITPDLLGLCLFDEQGSGKTVMSIAAFDLLKEKNTVDSLLIICPKSMLPGWKKDIETFLGKKYETATIEGSRELKRKTVLSNSDILISNYEGVEPIITFFCAKAEKKRFLLIVDESYYAKNEKAIRSEIVLSIRGSCKRCFVLCGTPAPNSPYDLINQFNIADLGYTFSSFTKTKDVENDTNQIENLISSRGIFIRRLKTEILNSVPEKNFHIIHVELTGRQKDMYQKAKDSLVLELKSYDNKSFRKNLVSYFQKRSALLQICAVPRAIDPTFPDIPAKYKKLDDLLNELFSQNRKVIIWTSYKASINELSERYSIFRPLVIEGATSTNERQNAVEEFQNNPERKLFIGNPSAAGAGITLHASHDAIYISYTNQAAHYLQSLDRIHRRGQKSDEVNYYLFVCQSTIEETEVIRLRTREIQQHKLLGDSVPWPTSLDEALEELITE